MTTHADGPDAASVESVEQPGDSDGTRRPSGDPAREVDRIELGWLLLGRMDRVDREAVLQARECMLEQMRAWFPQFRWLMPVVQRRDVAQGMREEPASLLEQGVVERDGRHWDFVFVVSGADLVSYDRPYALATPSRTVGVAALSTSRVDPQAEGEEVGLEQRRELMSVRVCALAMHAFGHLNGLDHEPDDEASVMYDVQMVSDLEGMTRISDEGREALTASLQRVADLRLEETRTRAHPLGFYLRAAWMNRGEIGSALSQAKPWHFPIRLSRLTTAALSGVLVLIHTAEVWEVATAQGAWVLVGLALAVLAGTAGYVLHRQRLVLRRNGAPLTEQTVVTNVSASLIVGFGMLTTYMGLFVLAFLLAWLVFPPDVVASWLSGDAGADMGAQMRIATFLASVGIVIGALGASFEDQHYVRHVAYVDEET